MKRCWRLALALLGAGLLLAAPRAFLPARAADPPAEPSGSAAQSEKEPKKVQIKWADHLRKEGSIYHLSGNIVLVQDDVTMTMDKCDYNDAENTAVASGHLKIVDPESTLTGDSVQADFDQKLAQVIGNVTIVTQRKQKEAEEETTPTEDEKSGSVSEYREKKTTITCPKIDYYYADDKKQAMVYGPLKAVQEDKTVYADQADYDGIEEQVILKGNVRLVMESGSEFRCPKATISLNDDWVEAQDIQGVSVEEQEPPETEPPAPAEGGGEEKPPPPPATNDGG